MSDSSDDGADISRARQPLTDLRQVLRTASGTRDAERIHGSLIEVADGLIGHAERQARMINDIRSDLDRKQGIVTKIRGGEFSETASRDEVREFASSSNGDRWFLGRDEASGIARVVHRANPASGGAVTPIEVGAFLHRAPAAPEAVSLLKLIGTLVR